MLRMRNISYGKIPSHHAKFDKTDKTDKSDKTAKSAKSDTTAAKLRQCKPWSVKYKIRRVTTANSASVKM